MRPDRELLCIVGVIILLLSFSSTAHAQSAYRPGLSVGNYALYSVFGDQSENVTSSELTVTSVLDTTITIDFVDRYLDGSSEQNTYSIDVRTGILSNAPPEFYFAIAGGLGQGNRLFEGSVLSINRTETRKFAGVERPVNVLNISNSSRSRDFYWDRSTGLLSGVSLRYLSGGVWKTAVNATVYQTDAWGSNPPSGSFDWVWLTLIPVGLTAMLAVGILVFRKSAKGRKGRK